MRPHRRRASAAFLWAAWGALAGLSAHPSEVRAAEHRIAVGAVDGPGAEGLRGALEAALSTRSRIVLVPQAAWQTVESRLAQGSSPTDLFTQVAQELGVVLVVEGTVTKEDVWAAEVRLRDPRGRVLERWQVSAKKYMQLGAQIRKKLWKKLGPAILGALPTTRVVVMPIRGSKGPAFRRKLVAALARQPGLSVVGVDETERTRKERDLDLEQSQDRSSLARSLEAAALLGGGLKKSKGRWMATIDVFAAVNGTRLETVSARSKRHTTLAGAVAEAVLDPIERSVQPAPRAPAPTEPLAPSPEASLSRTDPPPSAPVLAQVPTASKPTRSVTPEPSAIEAQLSARRTKERAHVPLDVAVLAGVLFRSYSYASGQLRPYQLDGAMVLSLDATWFPAGHFTREWLAHLGLNLGVEHSLLLETKETDGTVYPSRLRALRGHLVARIPIASRHHVSVLAGARLESFGIEEDERGSGSGVPGVGYVLLGGGLAGRVLLTKWLGVLGRFEAGLLRTGGDLGSAGWFPDSSGFGIDASLGLTVVLIEMLEVRAVGALRRRAIDLGVESSDPRGVTDAVDQYWVGSVGLAFRG